MSVILISGNSGQGKTTVAKNVAFALRGFGFDVLLVDSDLRTPKLGHHFGMPLVNRTIQDVLLGVRDLKDAVYQCPSGLKLLLSGLVFVDVPHPSTLLSRLRQLADVVIVDVPAYDFAWYETECDVLLVTQPDFPSVLDVQKLSKFCNVRGLLVNRSHNDSFSLSANNIRSLLSLPVFGVVPEESRVREALHYGYPVVEFHPELQASNVLKSVAAKLMNLEYNSPLQEVSLLAKFGL